MRMLVKIRYFLIVVGITLFPVSVSANAGIGYFMVALPLVVFALIPAVPLEGFVLRAVLGLRLQYAFLLSLGANGRSTLYGFLLAIIIDIVLMSVTGSAGPEPTKAVATAMLAPFFLYSWWIEHRVIARRKTDLSRYQVATATGVANLLSYTGMLIFIWTTAFLPERPTMPARVQLSEAVKGASSIKADITDFWQQNNRFPADVSELDDVLYGDADFSIALGKEGRVLVQIHMPDEPLVDNKELVLTPLPDTASPGDSRLRWKCSSEEISPRFLPARCRS